MYSQFVETLKRLYKKQKINKEKISELCKNKKLTNDEMNYILDI